MSPKQEKEAPETAEWRKYIPTIALAVITTLVTGYINTQVFQGAQVTINKEQDAKNLQMATAAAENAKAINQQAVQLAELSTNMTHVLTAITSVQDDQKQLRQILLNKK